MTYQHLTLATAVALAWLPLAGNAQDYTPDIAEFALDTGLSFAGHPAFYMGEGGTIEFWVAPDWEDDPGYDPVVLSSDGEQQLSYVFSMLGDKSGFVVQTRDQIGEVDFDFGDGALHHVAVICLDKAIVVMVDGQPLDELPFTLPNEAPVQFYVGSINGEALPFVGAIGGLRFWDVALEPEELVTWAMLDPLDPEFLHPDVTALGAYSDLTRQTIEVSDFLWGDEDDAAPITLVEATQ